MPTDVVEPPDYYLHKLEGPAEMIARVRSVIPSAWDDIQKTVGS